jgi:hypothetical protein
MSFSNCVIDDSQAKQFANVIYTEIADYIKNHKEEYDKFLQKENDYKNININ